jgi:hypothetical protein
MNAETTRAEIYELARLLRVLGDADGARRVMDALALTEDAAMLTGIARLERLQKESDK